MELTGKIFGDLTVIKIANIIKYERYWLCKCSCGTEKVFRQNRLMSNKADNCGCKSGLKRSKAHYKNLVGKKFNNLTVIEKITKEHRVQKETFWLCKCDCGNEKIVHTHSLKSGNTKSCGCEKIKQTIIKLTKGKIGDKFKRLTILKIIPIKERTKKNNNCECLCDCGKIIQTQLSRVMSGNCGSCGCLNREISSNNTGSKSARWNKDISDDERSTRRQYKDYYIFRKLVFERDNYICKICNHKGYNQVHHIINYSTYKDGRTDINNAITLCKKHHKLFHKIYGIKNNTKIQLVEFMENIKNEQ